MRRLLLVLVLCRLISTTSLAITSHLSSAIFGRELVSEADDGGPSSKHDICVTSDCAKVGPRSDFRFNKLPNDEKLS
jgi:hypothetical protein